MVLKVLKIGLITLYIPTSKSFPIFSPSNLVERGPVYLHSVNQALTRSISPRTFSVYCTVQ